jgi:hypothetical protein
MSKHPHPDPTRSPSFYGRVPQGALFRIDGDTALNGTDTIEDEVTLLDHLVALGWSH